MADPQHWNVSARLDLAEPAEPELVRDAVEQLMIHHDGLRQRILVAGEATRVRIAPRGDVTPFEVHDLSDLAATARPDRVRELVGQLQTSLDLAVGPLLRVGLFRGAGGPDKLAVIAHRLVADAASLNILLDDLSTALAQLRAGQPVRLPAKTTSWQSWVRRLVRHGRSDTVQSQREYWTSLVTGPAGRLPADGPTPDGPGTVAAAREVTTTLDAGETGELLRLPDVLGCGLPDVLLAALGRTLSSWTGTARQVIELVRTGREQIFDEVDLTRTVGPCGHVHPVVLDCDPDGPPEAAVRTVKDHLRSVPTDGIGWQLLRQDSDPVPDAPADLAFSYLAETDRPGPGSTVAGGPDDDMSPRNRRQFPLMVSASLTDDVLIIQWTYDPARFRPGTIAQLAGRLAAELRTMLGLGRESAGAAHTPADFPLANVDQAQLDELLSKF